jgi:Flp pilus assembly protein TadB
VIDIPAVSLKQVLVLALVLVALFTLPFLIVWGVFLLPGPMAISAMAIIVVVWVYRMRKRASTREKAGDELPSA